MRMLEYVDVIDEEKQKTKDLGTRQRVKTPSEKTGSETCVAESSQAVYEDTGGDTTQTLPTASFRSS